MLKKTSLQGSTLSGPCMTMGFDPFELPTQGILQKGWDHWHTGSDQKLEAERPGKEATSTNDCLSVLSRQ